MMSDDGSPEKPDRIEVWGRRIGRAISYILLIVLVIYLFQTYIAP
jgi:hypothetical protein